MTVRDGLLDIPGLGQYFALQIIRDLRLAFRNMGQLANPLMFFVMVTTLFPLALNPSPQLLEAIAPGVVLTPFHAKTEPDRLKAWQQNTPLRMHGQPKHIAMAMPLLIENEFMTGETIDINGGWAMR